MNTHRPVWTGGAEHREIAMIAIVNHGRLCRPSRLSTRRRALPRNLGVLGKKRRLLSCRDVGTRTSIFGILTGLPARTPGGPLCAGATDLPLRLRAACTTALGPHTPHYLQCHLHAPTRYAKKHSGREIRYANGSEHFVFYTFVCIHRILRW